MKAATPTVATDPSNEIAALVQTLHQTQQRLEELTGGQVDAVLHQGGHSYMLHEAQAKLRESESDQRRLATTMLTILNALPAHICLLDANGIIVSVNQSWRLFALFHDAPDPEHGVERNYLDICDRATGPDAEYAQQTAAGIRDVLAGARNEFSLEYPCPTQNKPHWFQVVVAPLGDERPGGAVVMHIDITERKLAEEALRAAAGSLAVSQRIAHLGSWEMDLVDLDHLRSNPLRWSDEMYRIFGYEPHSVAVTPDFYLQHVPGGETGLIEQRLQELLRDNRRRAYYYPVTRSDGEIRIVQTQAQVLRDEKTGRPQKLFGTIHDVTEAKRNEEQILAEAALLEAQLNSTLDGISVVDGAGKNILQNQRMVDLWQMPPHIAQATNHLGRLAWFSTQVKHPDTFLEKARYLHENPDEISRDEMELIDGRVLDRYTAPVRGPDGRDYGRISVFRDISERKQAEQKMAEQVKLLSMAGQLGKLGAWAADYPGPTLIWSDEVYRMHEVEPEFELTPESAASFIVPESRWKLEAAIERMRPFDLELEIVTGKGNRRTVRITSSLEQRDGETVRLYGIFQDITKQKRQETRLRRLIDSNVQCVLIWSKGGAILDANDAFCDLVGYSREDLQSGRINWMQLTPPEDAPRDQQALEEIAERGICTPYEKIYIRKDGVRVPILIGSAVFEDCLDEGVAFVVDLTEQKRIEARFRRLIDSNVQNVMFWKKGGEITEANDAFLQLVGYTREDLQAGRVNWRAMTPPEYAQLDDHAMAEIAAAGVCKTYEKEYIRKNGSRVPVLIGAAAFEDNPDEGVRFVLDLTEIKKLEHQFLRAQRMESIGTLAGGIAHDLNNILAPILMAVQVLKMKTTDPQLKSMLETIEVSSKRGADIVRQVLSFARGLQGERVEVQPVHLLKDIETLIRDTFPKNIRRSVSFPDGAWTILGDPTQLHQILLNLCVNARDAMPDGGNLSITVENVLLDEQYVAMNVQARAGRYVMIDVTDTGEGIPAEILDQIFDPFFTTKDVGKGTGLGLSTVMAIIKSHAGFVNVYSEVGRGSSFKVYLPAVETTARLQRETGSLAGLPQGNGERILIIDDEASILTITRETLEAFGYKTLTAGDGAEAIGIYAQHRTKIAAVLTDMAMPVMDGPATIRALQRLNPAVKIIAATGLKTEGSEARALNAGVKHFLTKPYTASTLLKTLRLVLGEDVAGP